MLTNKKELEIFHVTYMDDKDDYFCKGINIESDTFSNAAFKFEREFKYYKIINISAK